MFLRACFAHRLSSSDRFALAARHGGPAIRCQVGLSEGFGVAQMCVESWRQRGTLLDDPDARVAVAVDVPFMGFRQAKPAFQGEVVLGPLRVGSPHEQPRPEVGHDFGHLLVNRLWA